MTEIGGSGTLKFHLAGWLDVLRGRGEGTQVAKGALGSIGVAGLRLTMAMLVTVVVARLLGPASFGSYAFATSIVTLLTIPAALGFPMLIQRETARYQSLGEIGLLRGLLIRSAQIVGVSTLGVAVLSAILLWTLGNHFIHETRMTIMVGLSYLSALVFVNLGSAVLMGLRRVLIGQIPLAIVWPSLFLLLLAVAATMAEEPIGAAGAMALRAVSGVAVLGWVSFVGYRIVPESVFRAEPVFATRQWLTSALLFAFLGGLWALNSQTDILMLGALAGERSVGIYRVAVSGAALVSLILGAVNTAILPTISRLHATGDRARLVRLATMATRASILGAVPIAAVLVFWGSDILGLVFGLAYISAAQPMAVLCLGQMINVAAGPVAVVLNMAGHEKDSVIMLVISGALNVALNAVFIPRWGVSGAALATAVSTSAWNIGLTSRVWKRLHFAFLGGISIRLRVE